jgi:DNA-binding transcriptional MerR regulator
MNKSPDAFRTISEVAEDIDLPQHVLRFWETRFREIKPLKRGGGRRYYRPDDVDLLRGIKHLLYEEGYTIRGLQRILKEQGLRYVIGVGKGEIDADAPLPPPSGQADAQGDAVEDFSSEMPAPEPDDDGLKDETFLPSPIARRALTVSEITEPARPRSIFDRFKAREPEQALFDQTPRHLSAAERRSLQATLYELLECKRLLDQVRGG